MSEEHAGLTCHDCGAPLQGRFCHVCGQKHQQLRQPAHQFVREAIVELLGLDGRLWTTMRLLLFQPGRLTEDYRAGIRTRYLRPLRIYISTTLAFFFLVSLIDPAGQVEQQLGSRIQEDSTALASVRYELINQRMRDDSTRLRQRMEELAEAKQALDSLSATVGSEAGLDAGQRALDRARKRVESTEANNSVRLRRFRWQQEVLATYPPDSLIRPNDLAEASILVFPGAEGNDGDNWNFTTGLPEWAIRSAALRRLRTAETSTERVAAGAEFLRGMVNRLPAAMFMLLPVFAMLLKPLYTRKRLRYLTTPIRGAIARLRGRPAKGMPPTQHYYVDHLVFGLHTHAYAFVIFSLILLLSVVIPVAVPRAIVIIVMMLFVPVYFLRAQKLVYHEGWFRTLLKSLLLFSAYSVLLMGFGFTLAFLLAAALG